MTRKSNKGNALSHLSREEKLALLEAVEEKKRRQLEARESFVPNAGQVPVIEAFSKEAVETVLVLTGNGGGKTALGVNLAIESALGYINHTKTYTPVPARVYVVLDKPEKVETTWLTEIKKWYPLKGDQCHKQGKPYISMIQFPNGSELRFLFHDQEPMSFESIEGDVFIFDEPPPRPVFIALRRAGRKKGRKPKYLIIGTPIAASWLRTELYEPWARGERPEIECFRFSTEVNKSNLSDGYIESFSKYLTDKEIQVRLHGSFFDLDGLALAHLIDEKKHFIPMPRWPQGWPVVVAVDFHPRKSHVAIMLGITDKDELIVLKEMTSRSIPSVFARELKEFYKGYRVVDLVCDSLGNSDLTGGEGNLSFIKVLQNNGVRIRATRFDEKNDESWIQAIQEILAVPLEPDNMGRQEPRLKFVNTCKGSINDVRTVEWQRFKNMDEFKPRLGMASKDFLSCIKYAVACQPTYLKAAKTKVIKPAVTVGWGTSRRSKYNEG
jgi:hypothetical protein